jgi:hypothetical protein
MGKSKHVDVDLWSNLTFTDSVRCDLRQRSGMEKDRGSGEPRSTSQGSDPSSGRKREIDPKSMKMDAAGHAPSTKTSNGEIHSQVWIRESKVLQSIVEYGSLLRLFVRTECPSPPASVFYPRVSTHDNTGDEISSRI